MSDDSSAPSGHDTPDPADQPEWRAADTQPLDLAPPPEEMELEPDDDDQPSALLDPHSQPVQVAEGQPVAAISPSQPAVDIAQQASPAPAGPAVAEAVAKPAATAVQATQAVVGTA